MYNSQTHNTTTNSSTPNTHHPPPYHNHASNSYRAALGRSPDHSPISPRNQTHQLQPQPHPQSTPQSSAFHRQYPPPPQPSAPISSPRDKSTSTLYDPASEQRRPPSWGDHPSNQNRSPDPKRPPYPYSHPVHNDRSQLNRANHSPQPSVARAQPASPFHTPVNDRFTPATSHAVNSPPRTQLTMGPPLQNNAPMPERAPPPASSSRTSDPMSFSNILASTDHDGHRSPHTPRRPLNPTTSNHQPQDRDVESGNRVAGPFPIGSPAKSESSSFHESVPNGVSRSRDDSDTKLRPPSVEKVKIINHTEPSKPTAHPRPYKPKITISDKQLQAAMAKVDSMELSDIEDGHEFETEKLNYLSRREKRALDLEVTEKNKRKRRRIAHTVKLANRYDRQFYLTKDKFIKLHEDEATRQVMSEDAAQEKERKRVQQRNRRRELIKQRSLQEAESLKQQADAAENSTERERLIQNAEKAKKKAAAQTKLLNGEVPSKDIREVTPLAPNLDGGVMSSFPMDDEASQEPAKKKGQRTTGKRPKKSKEKKQAEKDSAAAAHERGEDLVAIAPKSASSKAAKREQEAAAADSTSMDRNPAALKAYDHMYEAIWKDIAQQIAKKVTKIKKDSTDNKVANLRKTAVLASKEARRWQIKTNKSTKDTQARAKRVMREMLSFWKKNERDERDQRKLAEKLELDRARQAEKEREDNRQKRKLNFLISQTELYSHFIGKKVRTEEAERSSDDVAASDQLIKPGDPAAPTITLPDNLANTKAKVTSFEDLDFDAEDDEALQQAAMASAQNAIQEAQDRARAFNNPGDNIQSQFDDGEMNFQNPTSLQSMDVAQPKMLACQLKEYQLKGLNWLVNLYEQGINGILADEMGLGKTVQSISVMAYLAEQHNIWGPFLVIAPASTLHNWQQEITRFAPGLKVLPYWGSAKDRKVLRKYWDRKHITYNKESSFHVLVTSYQLVVQDQQYFQKVRWQYMILDEAQAIKSSQSSRWKSLLGFHCRNRLLLTGTPIQNSMQELWALLHFIMPSLFDSHDEFSEWFSKDIESHAQSNTKLNEDQLKRLHMILKPFMLRRIKKHVQKELGDKIEEDVFCDLTYRQRAYYTSLRNKISLMDLVERAAIGDEQDTATLMNLVMQFRKVCNHPDLFERADTTSPMSFAYFAETASFLREGHSVEVGYSVRNHIELRLPKMIARGSGRIDLPGPENDGVGWRNQLLSYTFNIFAPDHVKRNSMVGGSFGWLNFINLSAGEVARASHKDVFHRAVDLHAKPKLARPDVFKDEVEPNRQPLASILNIVDHNRRAVETKQMGGGVLEELMNISANIYMDEGINAIEPCAKPAASAPPVEIYCSGQGIIREKQQTFFNVAMRRAFFKYSEKTEQLLMDLRLDPVSYPPSNMLPPPISEKALWTSIQVPSMRRFVTDSGKLARLDQLLGELKEGGHRVLLYFQMTRMIDLMEEYLTYRNYKYCRLDGSTKLEDRRDTVADFQTRDDIFVFLLSTRAGGLGINLTAADTVIFYDSDWNPTIDSQAMDRAHRLGQTKQVTVYRMITRSTIEERIRKRALQKEEVQRVVISGGAGAQVDFNTRSRENRTKDIAMWLADDDQAEQIEKREAELAEKEAKEPQTAKSKKKAAASAAAKRKVEMSLDDMYHEGEGNFDDSNKPSGAATPVDVGKGGNTPVKRAGKSKKAKTVREKLAFVDGGG